MELAVVPCWSIDSLDELQQHENLHRAIEDENILCVHNLIKQGVDINLYGFCNEDPPLLHVAITTGNLEIVCMLLFYGAEVHINYDDVSPLDLIFRLRKDDLLEIFDHYYDRKEFLNSMLSYFQAEPRVTYFETSLEYFSNNQTTRLSHLAYVSNWTPIFKAIFQYESFTVFKVFWRKVTSNMLDDTKDPVLYTFFQVCSFPHPEFLECCYLLLDSPKSSFLLEQFNKSSFSLWHMLSNIDRGIHYTIKRADRLGLIYIFLSLGIQVNMQDIVYVFNTNGYEEELMALIYAGQISKKFRDCEKYCLLPLPTFILVLEENSGMKTIFKLFRNLMFRSFAIRSSSEVERFLYYLRFFYFSPYVKEKLIHLCNIHVTYKRPIIDKIKKMPTVPSLVELARNQTRLYIKKKYKIKKPYEFYDVVKNLNVPCLIRDILVYKTPIYE